MEEGERAFSADVAGVHGAVEGVEALGAGGGAVALHRSVRRAGAAAAVGGGPDDVDGDQAWFWSERWQRMEREGDEDIAAGRLATYEDIEQLLAGLDASEPEQGIERRIGSRRSMGDSTCASEGCSGAAGRINREP